VITPYIWKWSFLALFGSPAVFGYPKKEFCFFS